MFQRSRTLGAKRHYQRHGLHTLEKALDNAGDAWLDEVGEVGATLRAWRDSLVVDLGGDQEISAQKRVLVDLACRTYVLLEKVKPPMQDLTDYIRQNYADGGDT